MVTQAHGDQASLGQGGQDVQPGPWGSRAYVDRLLPAKLHSPLAPKGLVRHFHIFSSLKLELLGKPTVLRTKVFANLMQTKHTDKETVWVETDSGDNRNKNVFT